MNQCQQCGATLKQNDFICKKCGTKVNSHVLPKLDTLEDLPESEQSKTLLSKPKFEHKFKTDSSLKRNIFNTPISREYRHHQRSSQVEPEPNSSDSPEKKVVFSPITSPLHSHHMYASSDHALPSVHTPAQFPTPFSKTHAGKTSTTSIITPEETIPRSAQSFDQIPYDSSDSKDEKIHQYREPIETYPLDESMSDDFDQDFTEVRQLDIEDKFDDSMNIDSLDSMIDDFDILDFDDSLNATSIEDLSNHSKPPEFTPPAPYQLIWLDQLPKAIPITHQQIFGTEHPILHHTNMLDEHFMTSYEDQLWWVYSLHAMGTWVHIQQNYQLKINQSIKAGHSIFTLKYTKDICTRAVNTKAKFTLLVETLEGQLSAIFPLEKEVMRVGRGQGNIRVDDPYIDYMHFAVQQEQKKEQVIIHNLQGNNGVWRPLLDKEEIRTEMLLEANQYLFQVKLK